MFSHSHPAIQFLSFEYQGLCAFAPGYSGEHHEGEDAQERRTLVVLMAGQKQQLKVGTVESLGIYFACKFAKNYIRIRMRIYIES